MTARKLRFPMFFKFLVGCLALAALLIVGGTFVVRNETYAHPDSAVVVASGNALNPRYSLVVYAGLGARATRQCVENVPNRGGEPAEVLLMPVGLPIKALRLSIAPLATAMP